MFVASSTEAARLDRAMREDLADSLQRLGALAASVLPADVDMSSALGQMRDHRAAPGLFARYYDLVFALQRHDHASAADLWREIAGLATEPERLNILPCERGHLGDDSERFSRLLALGDGGGSMFAPPPEAAHRFYESNARDALSLLARVDAEWSGEVDALVSLVVTALPAEGAPRRFANMSSFMTWGAIFTNVGLDRSRLQVLASLVHEASHLALFGLSRREALVDNPASEKRLSPLRHDPRPVDGVFHATWISARLARLYQMLACAGAELTAEEMATVRRQVAGFRRRFQEGHEVIASYAALTPLGRRLIEEAADHVLAAA